LLKKMIEQARKQLIFALDVETLQEAETWVKLLRDRVGVFKVGKQLFTRCGPDAVRMIQDSGGRVFLDLKYHDIPNTVAKACLEAAKLGVAMFTLHATGGSEMMARAASSLREMFASNPESRPLSLAVTILTSMNEDSLKEVGVVLPPTEIVPRLADLARRAGMDGVVASPQETSLIRKVCGKNLIIVTPGVRPSSASRDDQKRVATPYQAILSGADYLVVGRPIAQASDPGGAAEAILEEMARAFQDR
jgi:orotidine-5'-phosphate decarboxylase